jgi:hypothetical protein
MIVHLTHQAAKISTAAKPDCADALRRKKPQTMVPVPTKPLTNGEPGRAGSPNRHQSPGGDDPGLFYADFQCPLASSSFCLGPQRSTAKNKSNGVLFCTDRISLRT